MFLTCFNKREILLGEYALRRFIFYFHIVFRDKSTQVNAKYNY